MARRSFYAKYAWPLLIGFAVATPLLFWGAARAVISNTNKVEDWLPRTYRETSELQWFRKYFEADQFVVVSWEGCRLGGNPNKPDAAPDDPRIERLAEILQGNGVDPVTAEKCRHYFKSVITARQVLRQLTDPPSEVPYAEAVKRLQGALVGPDGQQTCVVVTLTQEAIYDMRGAIARGWNGILQKRLPGTLWQAIDEAGIDAQAVHVGGPPVDNVAIDEEGERTLVRLAALSGAFGLVLAWWSLRSVRLTLIVFACGILSAALGLALVWFTGNTADAVLMSMPSLVYVLAISGAVHWINYYRGAILEGGLAGAVERALAHAWKPAFLCSVTTAIGLASLATSDLVPIRKFGIYSAAGVMGMLVVLFLYLPSALQIWPMRKWQVNKQDGTRTKAAPSGGDDSRLSRLWGRLAEGIIARHAWVMLGCMLVIGAVGYGVTRVSTSIDLLKLFDSDARILQDYAWLEKNLGRLVPMEIVLRFPRATQESADLRQRMAIDASAELSFLDRIKTVALAQEMIETRFGPEGQDVIGATMSAATFAPKLPSGGGGAADVAVRTVTNNELTASRDAFVDSGYLQLEEDGTELWRISVRVAAFQNVDYGTFAADLKEVIEPALAAHHFRREVLRTLDQRREGGGPAGAPVVFWHPQAEQDANDQAPPKPPEVFETALVESLRHVNLGGRFRADPAQVDDRSLDKLESMGCVVLLGSFADSQVAMLAERGVPIVDARWPVVRDAMTATEPVAVEDSDKVSAVYTGVVPIVYKAQRALLDSLISSTAYSFLTITPLMMFVTRSIPAGLVVMLPNVLPILVIFGGMGWLGIPVDIGSMMSASIALGVAVDDTIHYLAWFRDDLKRLGDRRQAIVTAYRNCATPTLQAALISGLGLSVFAFSTFTPTQRFGWLMLTILIAGVVAELVMLPALLAGPLGRVFRVKKREPERHAMQVGLPHSFHSSTMFRQEEVAKRAAGR